MYLPLFINFFGIKIEIQMSLEVSNALRKTRSERKQDKRERHDKIAPELKSLGEYLGRALLHDADAHRELATIMVGCATWTLLLSI